MDISLPCIVFIAGSEFSSLHRRWGRPQPIICLARSCGWPRDDGSMKQLKKLQGGLSKHLVQGGPHRCPLGLIK